MTRLIHLTDLHFGLHRADLVEPMLDEIRAINPDLVVVSGDLTQRGLAPQYAQAMAFLRSLGLTFMVIPGNHDIPAYNPLMRMLAPFAPFRQGASDDLTPALRVGSLRLFGINTVDQFRWRRGRVRTAQIDRICQALRDGPDNVTNILVAHHPFEEPPGFQRGETRGARVAMERLAEAGLHVILSGHLHHWVAGLGIAGRTTRPLLQMQTGTALCSRARERDHGFALMDFDADWLTVTPWIVNEATLRFEPQARSAYARRDGQWHAVG